MNIKFTALEARVIGCLIEKEITTPDQYPLSLNALVNACNQKSNRDPLLDVDERAVQDVLDALTRRHLVLERAGFGSRVPKYQHRFCNTDFGALKFSAPELALLCELLLRGPQTPGELRVRANRMASVSSVEAVEAALQGLANRSDGPFVVQLAREPNRRDCRWAQLFSDLPAAASATAPSAAATPDAAVSSVPMHAASTTELQARVATLETQVAELAQRLSALEER
jgi:uncharacterized protein YceH (UPF0502 family)